MGCKDATDVLLTLAVCPPGLGVCIVSSKGGRIVLPESFEADFAEGAGVKMIWNRWNRFHRGISSPVTELTMLFRCFLAVDVVEDCGRIISSEIDLLLQRSSAAPSRNAWAVFS